ncbi:Glu/Leu/Phe/Val dehydrogenase [Alkalicaulis satelles]|uniref:Glu/Leu/Phe/Val dehydrogenase n=1 Tax=Alkalicaulis satelles TaxID=2609175 RepID=A0A5M6ZC23_9PROT|nr:Glu/Leu/Phe/Val dehydrogenase dimerization domain-containing protein [Alkalicaulis satelles]KAA5801710.1 Glu/Leu/Phe/Val dehydrogenase [Alkalicaulis satelles]
MSVFEHPAFDDHEKILFAADPETGLKAILAVHSTARGPAVGGCRMWSYASSAEALTDVLRLSQGMSYKNIMADLPIGGGKSVIMRPEGEFDREALFEAFGRALESLNGAYISAEDVGVSPADMVSARRATRHVVGLPDGTGDPSPVTARGVFMGIQACVERGLGKADLNGVRIAVQGATGHVGAYLCRHLAEAGAELFLTDIKADPLEALARELGAQVVTDPNAIYDVDADVFAPCALGAVINPSTIGRLKVKIVAGAANNQLETRDMGKALMERGILYAPDYVINAGGIINVMGELDARFDAKWVSGKLETLKSTLGEIIDTAASQSRPANQIADELARERLSEAALAKAA